MSVSVQAIGEDYASREYVGTFETPKTGFARFDGHAFLALGGDTPSFEIATFAVTPAIEVASTSGSSDKYFEGLVGVDAEGWVVWYYHACDVEAWDFLPGGEVRSDSRL